MDIDIDRAVNLAKKLMGDGKTNNEISDYLEDILDVTFTDDELERIRKDLLKETK